MTTTSELEGFARLIGALEPWLQEVVIVGGWAHRIYRLDPHAQKLDYPPLTTLDTDVAIPAQLEVKQQDIRERLTNSGFREEFLGADHPPATHYHLGDEQTGFYAEFLTPLIGSGYRRDGERNAPTRIAGVTSQKLRYIDVLLVAPWRVSLDKSNGFPFPQTTQIQIANPSSFLAQKILIHRDRDRRERSKDILYIYDTLEVFGGRLAELRAEWTTAVKPKLHENSKRVVERAPENLFAEMNDTIREAARMATSRELSPEAILETCNLGLRRVFS